jgi:hypothetical protein
LFITPQFSTLTRMKALPPVLATLTIVLLLLSGYVAAYLWMTDSFGTRTNTRGYAVTTKVELRFYRHGWAKMVFAPAAWVESRIIGHEVQ